MPSEKECKDCLHIDEDATKEEMVDFIVDVMTTYKITSKIVVDAYVREVERGKGVRGI